MKGILRLLSRRNRHRPCCRVALSVLMAWTGEGITVSARKRTLSAVRIPWIFAYGGGRNYLPQRPRLYCSRSEEKYLQNPGGIEPGADLSEWRRSDCFGKLVTTTALKWGKARFCLFLSRGEFPMGNKKTPDFRTSFALACFFLSCCPQAGPAVVLLATLRVRQAFLEYPSLTVYADLWDEAGKMADPGPREK